MKGLMDLGMMMAKVAGPDTMINQLEEALTEYKLAPNDESKKKLTFFCMLTVAACSDGTPEDFAKDIEKANEATDLAKRINGDNDGILGK